MEHPNQKFANEVAEILRTAADHWLTTPSYARATNSIFREYSPKEYSCTAVHYCAEYGFAWSDTKVERVIMRFFRRLGVQTDSFHEFESWKTSKRQETRHAWLYLAAQVAEDCPDLVPTYGKKVKNALS